jgi:septal ring factor EnvC (AmiA/AmiB activator)
MKRIAPILSGLLAVTLSIPAFAQVTNEDIDSARREVNRMTEESAELGQEVIEAYGRQSALDQEITDLRSSIDFAQIKISETEDRLEDPPSSTWDRPAVCPCPCSSATDQNTGGWSIYAR